MKKNFFTFMDTPEFKQNWFDLGHSNSGSCNMGQLVPVLVEPTLPGDYFKCDMSYLLRMAQMVAPPMTRIGVSFFPFYCPNRILMDSREWDKFISDIDGTSGVSVPKLSWSKFQSVIYNELNRKFEEPSSYDYSDFASFLNSDVDFMDGIRKKYNLYTNLSWQSSTHDDTTYITLFGTNSFGNSISVIGPNALVSILDFGSYGEMALGNMLKYLFSKYLGSSPFVGSLIDYMGLPVNSPALSYQSLLEVNSYETEDSYGILFSYSDSSFDFDIQVLPFLAYLYIWNEYFRQEYIQAEIPSQMFESFNEGVADDVFDISLLWKLKRRCWEHDYYTSCLPSPQLGESSSIEIGEDGKFTIPELREANVIQRIREKMLHGGSRIWEILSNFFNERVSDSRIQKPEFIRPSNNTGFSWLRISDIYQTAPGSSDSFPSLNADANIAAPRGASANTNVGLSFNFKAEEHGYIIVLMNVQPDAVYSQGIPKHFTFLDALDYGWPDFANLTEQPVYDYEIYADLLAPSNVTNDYSIFGYQPQYTSYKFHNSELHGELRDDLDFFHFGRMFAWTPSLNSDFLECNPTDRPFPISYEYDKLTYHLAIDLRVNRRLPYYGIPSLR